MISKWMVISKRQPRGGFVSWTLSAVNPEHAIAAAHERQTKTGAWGVVLVPVAVINLHNGANQVAWGSTDGVPPSFLPKTGK